MRCGFSLVEVLVALSVAAIAVAATAHSGLSILIARRASDVEQAAALIAARSMESLLARDSSELRIEDSSDVSFETTGEFVVRKVVEPGPRDNLWHLSVTVTPAAGAPIRFHTLRRCRWSMR
ncbi:MAG: prepilin-type N-terminal cleavage/methylation domain-containing protein [Candidatus Binatia bacterium]